MPPAGHSVVQYSRAKPGVHIGVSEHLMEYSKTKGTAGE